MVRLRKAFLDERNRISVLVSEAGEVYDDSGTRLNPVVSYGCGVYPKADPIEKPLVIAHRKRVRLVSELVEQAWG